MTTDRSSTVESPCTVRPLVAGDLAFAARLHAEALPHGFFANLGAGYLRAYYRTFVSSPHALALVAERNGDPVGVVVGSVDAQAHHRFVIRRHGPRLAARGAVGLLTHPLVALEFMRTRFRRYSRSVKRAVQSNESPVQPQRVGVLAHIAVVSHGRKTGVGRALTAAFVEQASAAGAQQLELVTLADEHGASRFYTDLGWRASGESTREGRRFARFIFDVQ